MIKVKSHFRKGRVVRAHGRIKKENKAKKKGFELVKALEKTAGTRKLSPFYEDMGGSMDFMDYIRDTRMEDNLRNQPRPGYYLRRQQEKRGERQQLKRGTH